MLLLSEWKGCCALSWPRLQDPFMICGSCPEGEGLRQGPGLEEVRERHLLSLKGDFLVSVVPIFYATPHPLLF